MEENKHTHTHIDEKGNIITHSHTHTQTKAVMNRLSKIGGHIEAIKKMVENGRDCSEVLNQLAAVKAAVGSVSAVILKDHIEHCIVEAVKEEETSSINELVKSIERFIK